MLPKQNRIPSYTISELFRSGMRRNIGYYQVIYKKNDATVPRFAIIVSTKISKHAVVRNRIKRLVSESIRHVFPKFSLRVDMLIIVKQNISEKQQTEVQTELINHLSDLRLIL